MTPADVDALVARTGAAAARVSAGGAGDGDPRDEGEATAMSMHNMGRMLVLYRAATDQTVRDCAQEIGTSAATLSRVERGHQPDLKTWRKIEAWLLEKRR